MSEIPENRSKNPTPETKVAQKGMSLTAILRSTPPYVKNKAKPVILRKLTKPWTTGGYRAIQALAYDTSPTSEELHKVTIIGIDDKSSPKTGLKKKDIPPVSQQKKVIVDCDCDDFKFRWEYALWVHGAAKIRRSNGEPAVFTNPSNYPSACIAKGELVQTNKGLKPIETIKEGDLVSTLYGFKRVLKSGLTGRRKTITLHLSSGKTLTLTPDHRVFVVEDGLPRWCAAGEISVFHHVVTINEAKFNSKKETISVAEATLLGYLTSELYKGRFWNENPLLIKHFIETALSIKTDCIANVGTGSVVLTEDFERYFRQKFRWEDSSLHKVIPAVMLTQPLHIVKAFLTSLWDGDGCFTEKTCAYGSMSLSLVKTLQLLLGSFNIVSRITKNTIHKNTRYEGDLWLLRITDYKSKQNLAKLLSGLLKYTLPPIETPVILPNSVGYRHAFPVSIHQILQQKAWKTTLKEEKNKKDRHIMTTRDYLTKHNLCTRGHIDRINSLLNRQGVRKDVRTRAGGKPTGASQLRHLESASRELRYRKHLSKFYPYLNWSQQAQCLQLSKLQALKLLSKLDLPQGLENKIKALSSSKVVYDKITHISNSGNRLVYDLTIDETPHFTANSVVVHNCKHLYVLARTMKEKGM